MTAPPILTLNAVSTRYGDVVIHRDIDLQVACGEVLAVIGGSGSGKTTLLRIMLGLEQPWRGSVDVFGMPLRTRDAQALLDIRRRCGVLFQDGALFSALSVAENVAFPLRELKSLPADVVDELVAMKLDMVGIDPGSAGKMPSELSGGMVKRVALARALALNPELLFLDEPTAGLDPERSHGFVKLIESLRRALDLTVVMVTHDVDTLLALSDRVAVLADQHLLAVAPLWDVVRNEHPFVKNFFLGQRNRCRKEVVQEFRDTLAIEQPVAAEPEP
ncbi:ATP-binding cassette domain-containing protein [Oxalobacteraceae bacterium OM1]|nr:ATP-binding cassette domain-containing protein [Oxalobacteraceae bacterium OM1]